jgi:hypothetical protein
MSLAQASVLDRDPWGPSAKAWSTRTVKLAEHGLASYRSDPDDPGPQRFFVVAGTSVLMLPDIEALDALAERLDTAAARARLVARE